MQDELHSSAQRPSGEVIKPAAGLHDDAAVPQLPRDVISRVFGRGLLLMIRVYQVTLSSFLGGHCRYVPTCSHYAVEAVMEHGPWRGGWLALKRLLRCHPFVKGGYDPVPPALGTAQRSPQPPDSTNNQ